MVAVSCTYAYIHGSVLKDYEQVFMQGRLRGVSAAKWFQLELSVYSCTRVFFQHTNGLDYRCNMRYSVAALLVVYCTRTRPPHVCCLCELFATCDLICAVTHERPCVRVLLPRVYPLNKTASCVSPNTQAFPNTHMGRLLTNSIAAAAPARCCFL